MSCLICKAGYSGCPDCKPHGTDDCYDDKCQECCPHDWDDHNCLNCGKERDYDAEIDAAMDRMRDGD